jgi:Glycosyl hydrolase family 115/Gylcosyl hydrolase family 115 C-terminal domain
MRGIHDGPMQGPRGEAQIVDTLQRIFAVQRDLLARYVNPDPAQVPQIFCPYKEVLDYFLHDLKVPPDVTVVFPDDNFGYVRYFPSPEQIVARPGGFGVYYHISYLGNPLSYVWLNTTPPALIWEEMSKAYDHDMKKLWMLNVGDLKPGEIGIDFFLQLAWDIHRWNRENLPDYLGSFAAEQFGPAHASAIAQVLASYYRLGYQRKPEHLQWYVGKEPPRPSNFAYLDYPNEGAERLALYAKIAEQARKLATQVPPAARDAFYELVEYPVLASAAANQRLVASEMAALSLRTHPAEVRDWAEQFDAATADLVAESSHYNNDLAGGKWRGIMEDDPVLSPRSYRNGILRLAPAVMQFLATAPAESATPAVAQAGVPPEPPGHPTAPRFTDVNGVVSILAQDFSRKIDRAGAAWQIIPGLGRTGDAVAAFPTTAPSVDLARVAAEAPALQYDFALSRSGAATLHYNLIPTQPLVYGTPLRFAVALDDDAPQLVTITAGTGAESGVSRAWQENVLDNTTTAQTQHAFATAGAHTLKIYMIDPGVVLEKVVIDQGGLRPSYLGPPETLASAQR